MPIRLLQAARLLVTTNDDTVDRWARSLLGWYTGKAYGKEALPFLVELQQAGYTYNGPAYRAVRKRGRVSTPPTSWSKTRRGVAFFTRRVDWPSLVVKAQLTNAVDLGKVARYMLKHHMVGCTVGDKRDSLHWRQAQDISSAGEVVSLVKVREVKQMGFVDATTGKISWS